MSKLRFVGLDVHAETIAVAVAEMGGEVRAHGVIPNRLESIRKLVHKLGPVKDLRACYEAGPTGYVLYWQLTQLGVACEVFRPRRETGSRRTAGTPRSWLAVIVPES
jgi:transposase